MYKIQPYNEEVELMKRGRKGKQKKSIRTKGVNITNVINVSRGGGQRRRPPAFSPAVNVPYSNLFRPQINEPRSVAVTSASSTEQNNNILASIRKSQEISEGKLKAQIDDMGSTIAQNFISAGQQVDNKLESMLQRIFTKQSVMEQESGLMRQKSGDDKQKPFDFLTPSFTPYSSSSSSSRTSRTPTTPTIPAPTEPTASKKKSGRPRKQPKEEVEEQKEIV